MTQFTESRAWRRQFRAWRRLFTESRAWRIVGHYLDDDMLPDGMTRDDLVATLLDMWGDAQTTGVGSRGQNDLDGQYPLGLCEYIERICSDRRSRLHPLSRKSLHFKHRRSCSSCKHDPPEQSKRFCL